MHETARIHVRTHPHAYPRDTYTNTHHLHLSPYPTPATIDPETWLPMVFTLGLLFATTVFIVVRYLPCAGGSSGGGGAQGPMGGLPDVPPSPQAGPGANSIYEQRSRFYTEMPSFDQTTSSLNYSFH